MNDTDKKIYSLVQRLNTIDKEKVWEWAKWKAEEDGVEAKRNAKLESKWLDSLREKKAKWAAFKNGKTYHKDV